MARRQKTRIITKTPKRVPERAPGKRRPSGALTAEQRKRSATIVEHEPGPRGGRTRYRFPMPDKEHARLALQMLPRAKGLSAEEKAAVRRRARKILYGEEGPGKGASAVARRKKKGGKKKR